MCGAKVILLISLHLYALILNYFELREFAFINHLALGQVNKTTVFLKMIADETGQFTIVFKP